MELLGNIFVIGEFRPKSDVSGVGNALAEPLNASVFVENHRAQNTDIIVLVHETNGGINKPIGHQVSGFRRMIYFAMTINQRLVYCSAKTYVFIVYNQFNFRKQFTSTRVYFLQNNC
jgi:hypothetical protein